MIKPLNVAVLLSTQCLCPLSVANLLLIKIALGQTAGKYHPYSPSPIHNVFLYCPSASLSGL